MIKGAAYLVCVMIAGACLSLSACVWIHSSAISDSSGGSSQITATHSDYGILHLSEPTGITSAANADLTKQCQSGQVTDVQTELAMRDWFFIVQYYTVTASAICK
jgi:hypothetical protein